MRFKLLYFCVCFLTVLFPFSRCGQAKDNSHAVSDDSLKIWVQNDWNTTIPGSFSSEAYSDFDSVEISTFLRSYPEFKLYEQDIRTFYRHRNFAYAWFDKDGLIEHAGNLADRIMNLENEGLNKELPYYRSLDSLMYSGLQGQYSGPLKIKLELMLTSSYFAFADIAWEGMDASVSKAANWYLPRKKISYEKYLDSILLTKPGELISDRVPVYRQYNLLKNYLVKYRKLHEKDRWNKIKPDRKSYQPGDSSLVIKEVSQRLFDLGDYQGDTWRGTYDEELQTAIRRFQSRHGLKDDGILRKEVFDELNVPFESRLKQLMVNMERSRWLPVTLSKDYLVVNIPEFKLHVYNSDILLWSCNAVVGKAMHKTVVFSGDLKYVVFSPYWNVPPSITKNEILPGIRKDPDYLSKHDMEVFGYREGLPEIRQRPGPGNSLGLVKFLFPNRYNIYLHDTPVKSLFEESSRAFSHGCIRISEPFKLAEYLLRDDPSWSSDRIHEAMNAGHERFVTLKETVPVFIVYFTAFVDREGRINFRKDIYERDDRLFDMIVKN